MNFFSCLIKHLIAVKLINVNDNDDEVGDGNDVDIDYNNIHKCCHIAHRLNGISGS